MATMPNRKCSPAPMPRSQQKMRVNIFMISPVLSAACLVLSAGPAPSTQHLSTSFSGRLLQMFEDFRIHIVDRVLAEDAVDVAVAFDHVACVHRAVDLRQQVVRLLRARRE